MSQLELIEELQSGYRGLRMTAEEYLALPEDRSSRYELVDGVVCMTPSPTFDHQSIEGEVIAQIGSFLARNPLGRVLPEVDVKLRKDLVYRPDVVYLRTEKVGRVRKYIREAPDLVVEVISPDSRRYDSETKRKDYEAAGVGEYWLIDPQRRKFQFFVLEGGVLREAEHSSHHYAAAVLPGFELDLDRIRQLF